MDFSPDGQQVAIAGFHETLLYRTADWKLEKRLIGLSPRIESIRFSPDGKTLAVAGGQLGVFGEVQLWSVDKGTLIRSQSIGADTVFHVNWSHDGKLISVALPTTRFEPSISKRASRSSSQERMKIGLARPSLPTIAFICCRLVVI